MVFCSRDSTPLAAGNVRRAFRSITKAADIIGEDWTLRELRHAFVSILSDNDVPIEKIADLISHRTTGDLESGVRARPDYTVRRAAEDWLKEGLDGRSAKTIEKNEHVLAPILATIGARKLRELTAGDVHQALTAMARRYSSAALISRERTSGQSRGAAGRAGLGAGFHFSSMRAWRQMSRAASQVARNSPTITNPAVLMLNRDIKPQKPVVRAAEVTRTRTGPGPYPRSAGRPGRTPGTGDQPADVRPVLGWTDAADARIRCPGSGHRHIYGAERGAQRWAALPQTREPGRGFHGFDAPPGARP